MDSDIESGSGSEDPTLKPRLLDKCAPAHQHSPRWFAGNGGREIVSDNSMVGHAGIQDVNKLRLLPVLSVIVKIHGSRLGRVCFNNLFLLGHSF